MRYKQPANAGLSGSLHSLRRPKRGLQDHAEKAAGKISAPHAGFSQTYRINRLSCRVALAFDIVVQPTLYRLHVGQIPLNVERIIFRYARLLEHTAIFGFLLFQRMQDDAYKIIWQWPPVIIPWLIWAARIGMALDQLAQRTCWDAGSSLIA